MPTYTKQMSEFPTVGIKMKPIHKTLITLLTTLTVATTSVGCSKEIDEERDEETRISILAAKQIMKNRQAYAKEIVQATNDCIKGAASIKTLAAASNDSAEVVEECTKSTQQAYGAYSEFTEYWLAKSVVIEVDVDVGEVVDNSSDVEEGR